METTANAPASTTTVGIWYESTKDLPVTDVAARIREDLKRAAGPAGGLLRGLTFSVRVRRVTHQQSVDVTVIGIPDEAQVTGDGEDCYRSDFALEVVAAVTAKIDMYNRTRTSNEHDDYYNVRFFSSVTLETSRDRAARAANKARTGALKAVKEWRSGGGTLTRTPVAGVTEARRGGVLVGELRKVRVRVPAGGTRVAYWGVPADGVMALRPDWEQALAYVIG